MEIRKAELNDLPKVHQLFCSYLKFYKRDIDLHRSLDFL